MGISYKLKRREKKKIRVWQSFPSKSASFVLFLTSIVKFELDHCSPRENRPFLQQRHQFENWTWTKKEMSELKQVSAALFLVSTPCLRQILRAKKFIA